MNFKISFHEEVADITANTIESLKEQVSQRFNLEDQSKMNFTTMRFGTTQKKMVTKELHLTQANKDATDNGVLDGALLTLVYSGKDLMSSRQTKDEVPVMRPEPEIKSSTLQENVNGLFDPNDQGLSFEEGKQEDVVASTLQQNVNNLFDDSNLGISMGTSEDQNSLLGQTQEIDIIQSTLPEENKQSTLAENANKLFEEDDSNLGQSIIHEVVQSPFDLDISVVQNKPEFDHDKDLQNELQQMPTMQHMVVQEKPQHTPTAGGWGMPPPSVNEQILPPPIQMPEVATHPTFDFEPSQANVNTWQVPVDKEGGQQLIMAQQPSVTTVQSDSEESVDSKKSATSNESSDEEPKIVEGIIPQVDIPVVVNEGNIVSEDLQNPQFQNPIIPVVQEVPIDESFLLNAKIAQMQLAAQEQAELKDQLELDFNNIRKKVEDQNMMSQIEEQTKQDLQNQIQALQEKEQSRPFANLDGEVCFSCDGNKINQVGGVCNACQGSGSISQEYAAKIQEHIADQMKNCIGPAFKALLGENRLEDLPQAFSNMSSMITSSMSMSMMDQSRINQPAAFEGAQNLAQSRIGKKYKLEERSRKPKTKKKGNELKKVVNEAPEASFEGEDFSDSYCVLAQQPFQKTWIFRNNGATPWPLHTELTLQQAPQNQGFSEKELPRSVALPRRIFPGEYVHVSIDFTAPSMPGKYNFVYSLREKGNDQVQISPLVSVDLFVRARNQESTFIAGLLGFQAEPRPQQPHFQQQQMHQQQPFQQQQMPFMQGQPQPQMGMMPQQPQQNMNMPQSAFAQADPVGMNQPNQVQPKPDMANWGLPQQQPIPMQQPVQPAFVQPNLGPGQQPQPQLADQDQFNMVQSFGNQPPPLNVNDSLTSTDRQIFAQFQDPAPVQQVPQQDVTAKQIYEKKINEMMNSNKSADKKFAPLMGHLFEFGFEDFDHNIATCRKFKGNQDQCLNFLFENPKPKK